MKSMKNLNYFLLVLIISIAFNAKAQEKKYTLTNNFDKIIVSPHIEANFVKGAEASIVVESIVVSIEKFKYELKKGTLQVYLEGAKTYTANKKEKHNGWEQSSAIYKNTIAKVTITYVDVKTFSVRGKEKIAFTNVLEQESCVLRIYGASEVTLKDVKLNNLKVSIYGESDLTIEEGSINKQHITAYGATTVSTTGIKCKEAKITTYGDGTFQFNASDKLKVTSYGESTILYKGDPEIKKGIVIGESIISRI